MRRGTVRVWVKWGLPAERTLLATLGDNDFFGERALEGTDGRTASAPPVAQATAECATYCDLLVLPRHVCEEVLAAERQRGRAGRHSLGHSQPAAGRASCGGGGLRRSLSTSPPVLLAQPPPDATALSTALSDERSALESLEALRRGTTSHGAPPRPQRDSDPSGRRSGWSRVQPRPTGELERAIVQASRSPARAEHVPPDGAAPLPLVPAPPPPPAVESPTAPSHARPRPRAEGYSNLSE